MSLYREVVALLVFSPKPQGTLGQYAPLSPTKYVSAPMSLPQGIHSQATSSGSTYRAVSQVGSLSQVGASGQFASRRGNYYSGLLPQSQATSSQYALGYSKPFPHPKALPVSLPVSCVPVSNMPLPPRAALELSLGPLLVLPPRE